MPNSEFPGILSYCKRYTVDVKLSSMFTYHMPTGFQWCAAKKCAEFLPEEIENLGRQLMSTPPLRPWDENSVMSVLTQYGIANLSSQKSKDLANDLRCGNCTLQVHDQNLYRVVDVTLLLLQEPAGSRHLVQTEGGSVMANARWPGKKRSRGESDLQAIEYVLPRMGLRTKEVALNFFDIKERVEKQVSLTYPGLQSIYRKHFVCGKLINTGSGLMKRVGLDG